MLQEVAHRISACVRDTDTVARLSGGEFTVILTDVTRPPHIATIATISGEILDALRQPFALAAGEGRVWCSIGIIVYPGDGATLDELVTHADAAMYAAKNAGRNQYRFFTKSMRAGGSDKPARTRVSSPRAGALTVYLLPCPLPPLAALTVPPCIATSRRQARLARGSWFLASKCSGACTPGWRVWSGKRGAQVRAADGKLCANQLLPTYYRT